MQPPVKRKLQPIIPAIAFLFFTFFLWIPLPTHATECKNAGQQLRGGYEATQGFGGGLWGLMEQTAGYRNDSTIGMQIDARLQRTVVIYETKCENGEKPGKDLADKISDFIDRAREIKNKAQRGTPDKVIPQLKTLNIDLGEFLDSLS